MLVFTALPTAKRERIRERNGKDGSAMKANTRGIGVFFFYDWTTI